MLSRRLYGFAFSGLILAITGCHDPETPVPFDPIDFTTQVDGLTNESHLNQFIRKSDGGYLSVGYDFMCCESDPVRTELLIFNIDQEGNLIWKKQAVVEGYRSPEALSACEVGPNKFLVSASMRNADNTSWELGLFQMDQDGNLTTINVHENDRQPEWTRIILDGTGGYYMASLVTESTNESFLLSNFVLEHYDGDNNLLSSKTINNLYWQPDFQVATSGDFLVAGSVYPNGGVQDRDLDAVRLTADGTIKWQHHLGGDSWDVGNSITESETGGVLLSGVLSYSDTPVLYKLDADGNLVNQAVLSDTIRIYRNEVHRVDDGYLVINVLDKGSYEGLNLMSLDHDLKTRWAFSVAGEDSDHVVGAAANPDGSFGLLILKLNSLQFIKTKAL